MLSPRGPLYTIAAVVVVLLAVPPAFAQGNPDVERWKRELQEKLDKARREQEEKAEALRRQWEQGKANLTAKVEEARARLKALEGEWYVRWGEPTVRLSGVSLATGEPSRGGTTAGKTLQYIDVEKAPPLLRPLAEKLNQGIQDARDRLFDSLPARVWLDYPEPINVLLPRLRLTADRGVSDQERALDCLSDTTGTSFLFLGDLAGDARQAAKGAGIFGLQLSSMSGTIRKEDGLGQGHMERTYVIGLGLDWTKVGVEKLSLGAIALTVGIDFGMARSTLDLGRLPDHASAPSARSEDRVAGGTETGGTDTAGGNRSDFDDPTPGVFGQESLEKQVQDNLKAQEREREAKRQRWLQADRDLLKTLEGTWQAAPGMPRVRIAGLGDAEIAGAPAPLDPARLPEACRAPAAAYAAALSDLRDDFRAALPEFVDLSFVDLAEPAAPRLRVALRHGDRRREIQASGAKEADGLRFIVAGDAGQRAHAVGPEGAVFDLRDARIEVRLPWAGAGSATVIRTWVLRSDVAPLLVVTFESDFTLEAPHPR